MFLVARFSQPYKNYDLWLNLWRTLSYLLKHLRLSLHIWLLWCNKGFLFIHKMICDLTLTRGLLYHNLEPFQIEPSYFACMLLVPRYSHPYKNFVLWPLTFFVITKKSFEIEPSLHIRHVSNLWQGLTIHTKKTLTCDLLNHNLWTIWDRAFICALWQKLPTHT